MPGESLLRVWIDPARGQGSIRGIAGHPVERAGSERLRKILEVLMENPDSVLQPVEAHVALGQVGQALLDFHPVPTQAVLPPGQKNGHDPAAASQIHVPEPARTARPGSPERGQIRQKNSIDRKPIPVAFLENKALVQKKAFKSLVLLPQSVPESGLVFVGRTRLLNAFF